MSVTGGMIYSFVKYREERLKNEYLKPEENYQDSSSDIDQINTKVVEQPSLTSVESSLGCCEKSRSNDTPMSTLVDEKVHVQPKITSLKLKRYLTIM